MIRICNLVIDKTLKYLENVYPTEEEVFVHICEGYETIETPEGFGFAVYVPLQKSIYVASEIPNDEGELIKIIAHEYMHFLQHCNDEEFDEEKADRFGELVYKGMKDLGWLDD